MEVPDYSKLRNYCYFSKLSNAALKLISDRLDPVTFPAGTVIVEEGSLANSFYLLAHGEVEVTKITRWGQEAPLSVLGTGSCFGEMALLTCSPRCCTVVAKTDVELLRLDKGAFEEIVRLDATFADVAGKRVHEFSQFNQFKTLRPFALLPPEKLAALAEKLVEERFADGEPIINQGEEGNVYFVLKTGRARVLRSSSGGPPQQVDTIEEGEGFGEEALITGAVRNATVEAVGDVIVWALDRRDFEEIMKASFLEEVFPEEIDGMQDPSAGSFIDVRLPEEFVEQHIPGAANLPFNQIRARYSELRPNQVYYVYCLQGVRSASAAFLLNTNGFKARSIRGGINAWPGMLEIGPGSGVHMPAKPS